MTHFMRPARRTFTTGLLLSMIGAALPARAQAGNRSFRIGYQKAASTLVLLRAHGTLEKRLKPLGLSVTWSEFPAGPQLLEGLNVGAIDFGYVGEAPPIFAQAAGADFVYTAYEIPTPHAEGVLVPQASPIRRVEDLKGKKVAFNRGSDVHWFIIELLRKAGLDYKDIQPQFLAPADARAAFERNAIDAWAIWDPFLAAAEQQAGARLLADATGVVSHHQFFLSTRKFAQARPDVVNLAMQALREVGQQVIGNYRQAAAELAPIQGLPADIIETGLRHYAHIYKPINPQVIGEQQKIADTFQALGLIPHKIAVRKAVLS